jgi:hypothetical protein
MVEARPDPTPTGRRTAVGVFQDRAQAERAFDALRSAGFTEEQIGMVMRDQEGSAEQQGSGDREPSVEEAGGSGAAGGGLLGGVLGAVAAGAIPGVGPIIAVGALTGIIGGAAIGAAAGGIGGYLASQGVPEDEAQYYEEEFKGGRLLVTVDAGDRYDEATAILRDSGGYDAESRSADPLT